MRPFLLVLLAGGLSLPAFAQSGKTNDQPAVKRVATPAAEPAQPAVLTPGLSFPASAGVVSGPFILTNGFLYQLERSEVGEGGKAIYTFTITNAGDYEIQALVNAPSMDANSFFLNIDRAPEDPMMIWDVDETTGFEERVVSWRGDGTDTSDQFAPKRFKLTVGKHQLFIYGREPETQLKSLTIRPAKAKAGEN